MRGKSYWLIYVLFGWYLIRTTISAFVVPWSWTIDQILFIFLMICLTIAIGFWAAVWRRGGVAAVKVQWESNWKQLDRPRNETLYRWSLLFWILVAVGLVIYFNLNQH